MPKLPTLPLTSRVPGRLAGITAAALSAMLAGCVMYDDPYYGYGGGYDDYGYSSPSYGHSYYGSYQRYNSPRHERSWWGDSGRRRDNYRRDEHRTTDRQTPAQPRTETASPRPSPPPSPPPVIHRDHDDGPRHLDRQNPGWSTQGG